MRRKWNRSFYWRNNYNKYLSVQLEASIKWTGSQLTDKYNTRPSSILSQHTVRRTLLDIVWENATDVPLMCLWWPSVIANYAYTGLRNIMSGPWVSEVSCLVGWIKIRHSSRLWPCQGMPFSRRTLLPQCITGRTQGCGGGIMLWEMLLWASIWSEVVVEQKNESSGLSRHHSGPVTPLHGIRLPNWKWSLPERKRPCHKAPPVLEWLQEHNAAL